MNRRLQLVIWILSLTNILCYGQAYDTLVVSDSVHIKMMAYSIEDKLFIYPKPKVYTFIQYLPGTFKGAAKISFQKTSLKGWCIVVGSTAFLLLVDQEILDGVQKFSKQIGLDAEREYKES